MAQPHTFNNPFRISRPAPFVEWQHSLPSRVADIAPCLDTVVRFIKLLADKFCRAEESEFAIETALREALANSVIHGNRQEAHKRVHITCRCSMDGEITITLQDEGEGFNSRALPDPTDAKNRLLRHGRGIYLMRVLMDEVCFEDDGRLVRMQKQLKVFEGAFPKEGEITMLEKRTPAT